MPRQTYFCLVILSLSLCSRSDLELTLRKEVVATDFPLFRFPMKEQENMTFTNLSESGIDVCLYLALQGMNTAKMSYIFASGTIRGTHCVIFCTPTKVGV